MRDRKFLRATTRVAPTFQVEQAKHVGATLVVALPATFQVEQAKHVGATLVVALPADCIPHVQKTKLSRKQRKTHIHLRAVGSPAPQNSYKCTSSMIYLNISLY